MYLPISQASSCTSCPGTQSELQMASGYLQGWSHVPDKRSHSCYCQKKLSLYWIPHFFAHFWSLGAGLSLRNRERGVDAGVSPRPVLLVVRATQPRAGWVYGLASHALQG